MHIATVGKNVWTAREVYDAYLTRWQIEIIFLPIAIGRKTILNLRYNLHGGCTNEHRVRVSIFLMLLFIYMFMQKIYVLYKNKIEAKTDKRISLLKLAMYVSSNIKEIIDIPDKRLKEIIMLHCCYDKRSDRINMTDLYQQYKN